MKAVHDKKIPIVLKIVSPSRIFYYFCRLVRKAFPGVFLLGPAQAIAQKTTNTVEQIWFSYHNQIRFSNKWGLWNDGQLRTRDNFTRGLSIYILRTGLMYHINDDLRITGGYAYAHTFPVTHKGISQEEHRPWQQILWQNRYPSFRFTQSLRFEQRFRRKVGSSLLPKDFDFNYRLRHNLALNFAFNKKPFEARTFSYVASNDLHVNFGKEVVYNSFDQNRVFLAAQYHTDNQDFLQLGYLYIYQQTGPARYQYTHAARITYMHIVDLRKRKQKNSDWIENDGD